MLEEEELQARGLVPAEEKGGITTQVVFSSSVFTSTCLEEGERERGRKEGKAPGTVHEQLFSHSEKKLQRKKV